MSLVTLANNGSIPARAGSVFLSNKDVADATLALPSSGLVPGWSCNIIQEDGAAKIKLSSAGSINGASGANGILSAIAGPMARITYVGDSKFIAQRIASDGAITKF